jgi:two-component system, OmpR family, phosphate regulon sensor histidine kinase PhoR
MQAWSRELLLASLLLLATAILGIMTGWLIPLLMLVLSAVIIWLVVHINRLEKWLQEGGKGDYPKSKGIWEDIYYHVYQLKKREKRRKKKLGKIIDQFRKSTDALPDAAIILGKNDEIEWANNNAKSVFNLKTADRGQRILNLIRFPVFVRYLKEDNFAESILIPSPANPQITLSVRIINYGAGLRLLIAQDVTQLKKMEQMRKNFVANVSHELRTPLTVLKGYLETLAEMPPGPEILTHSLAQMREQTERMQYLVADLLLLSNLETQPRKSNCVDIPQLLQKIREDNESAQGSSGRVTLTLASQANLFGDAQELRSAFSNLIENALKYSPAAAPVAVSWRETGSALEFCVADQGEGIAETEIPRITERFYRVDVKRPEKVAGTGLGLAIVKHVLIRHDAKLCIRSRLQEGSEFICQFPLERRC